jgi:hypothetical protein
MHRDVDNARLDGSFSQRLDNAGDPPSDLDPTGWNSRQNYRTEFRVTLDDFVRDSPKRTVDSLAIHHRKSGGRGRRASLFFICHVFLGDLAGSH